MNDTGNFVLQSSSNDTPVWETFKFPTDTLLPSQVLEAGTEVDSRMSESNFTKGRFQLRLLPDGNLVLNTRDLATDLAYGAYYGTGTNNPGIPTQEIQLETREPSGPRFILFRKLESATNGFIEEIGRGSFGVVYKGTITVRGNSITVAVKKLDRTFIGANKEFMAEVNAIGLTHHKNLVRFIGYCKEEDKRLLVYEYMPNGTVADYLFGDSRPSWINRIRIAQGVARGLLYLHEECTTQIIHCDIKPQNILVDGHYDARISDFGLAKLLALDQSQINTAVRGTRGYVAPEWFKNKPISMKVDVYSFGVLLLEIVCCRRCVRMEQTVDERAILTDWAFDCYKSGMLDDLVTDDMEALNDFPRLERFVKVGLWCIQEDPNLRPTMQRVNQMLDGVAEVLEPPCPTSFSVVVQD